MFMGFPCTFQRKHQNKIFCKDDRIFINREEKQKNRIQTNYLKYFRLLQKAESGESWSEES